MTLTRRALLGLALGLPMALSFARKETRHEKYMRLLREKWEKVGEGWRNPVYAYNPDGLLREKWEKVGEIEYPEPFAQYAPHEPFRVVEVPRTPE